MCGPRALLPGKPEGGTSLVYRCLQPLRKWGGKGGQAVPGEQGWEVTGTGHKCLLFLPSVLSATQVCVWHLYVQDEVSSVSGTWRSWALGTAAPTAVWSVGRDNPCTLAFHLQGGGLVCDGDSPVRGCRACSVPLPELGLEDGWWRAGKQDTGLRAPPRRGTK